MRDLLKEVAVLLMALAVFLVGFHREVRAEPPETLAGLKRLHALQGEEAARAVNRLHGKQVAGKGGYVAHYEKDGVVAMLYVSKTSSSDQASRQVKQMSKRIEQGNTPFFHLKASKRGETTVYSTLGEDRIHYFYQRDSEVIWLAVDPPVASQALADLLKRAQ